MSRSYKAKNKRITQRSGDGKFRQTTLRDFGFKDSDLSDGSAQVCKSCHHAQRAILRVWLCHHCGHENGVK